MLEWVINKVISIWLCMFIIGAIYTSVVEGEIEANIKNSPARHFSQKESMKMELICDYGKININAKRGKETVSVKTTELCQDTTDKEELGVIIWGKDDEIEVDLDSRWSWWNLPVNTRVFKSSESIWPLIKMMYLPQDLSNNEIVLDTQNKGDQTSVKRALALSLEGNKKLWPALVVNDTKAEDPAVRPVGAPPVVVPASATEIRVPKGQGTASQEADKKVEEIDIRKLISGQ